MDLQRCEHGMSASHEASSPTRRRIGGTLLVCALTATVAACAGGRVNDIPAIGDLEADRLLFERWKQAMGGHEAYEERKLYPFLTRRWGVSCATAESAS